MWKNQFLIPRTVQNFLCLDNKHSKFLPQSSCPCHFLFFYNFLSPLQFHIILLHNKITQHPKRFFLIYSTIFWIFTLSSAFCYLHMIFYYVNFPYVKFFNVDSVHNQALKLFISKNWVFSLPWSFDSLYKVNI